MTNLNSQLLFPTSRIQKFFLNKKKTNNQKQKRLFLQQLSSDSDPALHYKRKVWKIIKFSYYFLSSFLIAWSFVQSFAEPYTNYAPNPGSGLEFGFLPGATYGTGDYRYDLFSLEINPLQFHAFYGPTIKYGPFLSLCVYPFAWVFLNLIYWFGQASQTLEKSGLHIIISMLIIMIFMRILVFPTTFRAAYYSEKQLLHKHNLDKINLKYGHNVLTDKSLKAKKQQEVSQYNQRHGLKPFAPLENFFINTPIFLIVFKLVTITRPIKFANLFGIWQLSKTPSTMVFYNLFNGGVVYLALCLIIIPINYMSQKLPSHLSSIRNPNISTENTDPQLEKTKKIQSAMTFVFLLFTFFWSTGLAIYYFLNSLFTMLQTWIIHYLLLKHKDKKHSFDNKLKNLGVY